MSLDILNANFEGIVGDRKVADGVSVQGRLGRHAQWMQSNLGSFYGEQSERRRLFFGSTPAAGVAVPIYSSTTQQFVFYNPLGSNKKARLLKSVIGYISGTMVAGHFCYANQTLINSAITGTAALIQNGYLGAAGGPSGTAMNLYTAATVVAFTYLFPMGLSQVAQAVTATNAPWQMIDNIDGAITVPPGSAIAIAANVAAAVTATIGLLWEEEDLDA